MTDSGNKDVGALDPEVRTGEKSVPVPPPTLDSRWRCGEPTGPSPPVNFPGD